MNAKAISLAVSHAKNNQITGLPKHGAVLTDGSVFFYGWNSRERHVFMDKFNPYSHPVTIHAEIAAIAEAHKHGITDLSSFTLAVARVYRDGSVGNSQPCPICAGAIKAFNIGKVVHT